MWNMNLRIVVALLLCVLLTEVNCGKMKNRSGKQGLKFLKSHRGGMGSNPPRRSTPPAGLWPSVFNLATKADITANATCGESGREEFCRMAENGKGRCGICDNFSPDPGKRHSINFAIDGSNRWWQSPAVYYGPHYEYVTITIDLKQVYQIAYVIIKMANSPRPGTWILERSLDDENYEAWQYFARTDKECLERFGIPATKGKPHYFTDNEVICTSFYSKLTPMENGEIHTPLIQGRPGANETSPELSEFTKARFVRFRLIGLRGTQEPMPRWLAQDIWKDKRLFYSIRDISIGGQCVCNGHAENCRHNVASGHPECECSHHSCGPNCEKCCPMYNQRQWGPGSARDARQCLPCNCHGHASSCHYEVDVDRSGLSMDIHGTYQGGGVCDNCTDFTTGINCEKCMPGYYRLPATAPDAAKPCLQCDCDLAGAAGTCVQTGDQAGTCQCRDGYVGEKCEACAVGYTGFPDCQPCPCDSKGVKGMENCEEGCLCKENVEGKYCDRCKSGYFGLRSDIEVGCLPCYCSQVTTLCESALIKKQTIRSLKEWQITDLKVSKVVKPLWNGQSVFSLGNYGDFSGSNGGGGTKSFYWLAPEEYLGNKLEAYNSNFLFKVQWVVMRGDTSGEPTKGPNIVIIGNNGMKIGHGDDVHTSSKTAFQIKLNELDWYHIPVNIQDTSKVDSADYHGEKVTRYEFLSILSNLTNILLRSTFHTDQIEALLEEATLDIGDDELGYSSVERCSCPSGYTGLSCESCSFGYVRIYPNTTTISSEQSFCVKCDCNGHSPSCNADTGDCSCQHNTMGEKCERCAPGFYGNPIRGTPDDCKKCACPLVNDENNFSPSCQLDYFVEREEDEGNYVCTQCPKGYTGDHCEICDDGYFGNPMETGSSCQPCDCNGGPCDRKTGQCLSCRGNTEGWKCEKCKPDHYGEPAQFNCKACECDPIGSISKQCDNITGQCECKEKFTGRTCYECESGFGNVTALCTPCSCNTIGSTSEQCNTHTGICDCKSGVEGFHCDACQNLFYGFSEEGCKPCTCDPDGSMFLTCNQTTGACFCKPHYTGSGCGTCEDGYWKKNKVCTECKCNVHGTIPNTICDKETGKCECKQGVTGQQCTSCLPDHYGNIQTSCKKCDPCDKKGHICDPRNGRCTCPPLTVGQDCENCVDNSWGYEPGKGCKHCNCSVTGSSSQQCDKTRGICSCDVGFDGEKCNRCSFGYYGYPDCKKCNCDPVGTDEEQCQHGVCKCSNTGTCKCKQNVQGRYCNQCKENHYGLSKENSKGCTDCFCFGRSKNCKDALYHWSKTTRLERNLEEDNQVTEDELSLPKHFLGDLTPSYGGYLVVEDSGGYFDVFLDGNNVQISSSGNHNELQMTEFSNWKVVSRNLDFPNDCIDKLSRACYMVILQNVTFFMIKANNRIREVLLDKAKSEVSAYPITHSVEKCECPPQYTGLSCEDPNKGYYRYFSEDPGLPWIDRIIGVARTCECGGHSGDCHAETGHCKNCTHHTTGEHCERCEDGYYLDEEQHCKTCLCPSSEQNNAKSCSPENNGGFVCQCKKGYTGKHCDKCDRTYYSPSNSTDCIPCDCNKYGVIPEDTGVCDETGKCRCQEGFTGDKCNQCVREREYIEDGICKSCDECTMLLFDEVDRMKADIENVYEMFKNGIGPPWRKLTDNLKKHDMLSEKYKIKKDKFEALAEANDMDQYEAKVDELENRMIRNNEILEDNINNVDKLTDNSTKLLKETDDLSRKLINLIDSLDSFGTKHVSLKEALAKARQILKQIQQSSKTIEKLNDKKIFDYCSAINRKVDAIYGKPPSIPPNNIEDIKRKLNALFDLLSHVDNLSKSADAKNTENAQRLESVREKFEILKSKNKQLNVSFDDIVNKLNATEDVLEALETVYKDLVDISNFKEYDELDNRVKRQMEEVPEVQELYDKAVEHVRDLEKKVEDYHSMFNFTKDEWKKINASGAYEAIIGGIREARDSLSGAKESLDQARTLILTDEDGDNLDTKSNLAQTYSDRLKQRINNLKDLSKNLNDIKSKLDKLKYSILENGKANNDALQNLLKTNKNITSQEEKVKNVEKAIRSATEVSERMRDIYKKMDDIAFDKQFNFDKKYQKYQEQINPKEINHLNDDVRSAREALNSLRIPMVHGNDGKKTKDSLNRLNNVEKRLKELQNLISLAKQQVDGVDVPMSLKNCHMTYKIPKSQYFQSLSITFNCDGCTLFNWTKPTGESLSVRVQDENVIVNVEGEDIVIDKITTGETVVALQKSGALLRAQVGKRERSKKLEDWKTSMSFINPDDVLEVGVSDNIESTRDISYIYKVILNGENFGVWNFADTNGNCVGQRRNVSIDESMNNLFNGKGYFEYGINSNLNPRQFSILFEFSTFDENGIIYVAAHFPSCSFVTLYLENGQIHFLIRLSNNQVATLTNNEKVNDGKVHLAEISWILEKHQKLSITYTLAVDHKRFSTPPKAISASNVFKLKETKHYLGGVPPTFNRSCVPVEKQALLGFLELKSQLNNAKISYGITRAKTLSFTQAWINDHGYLNIDHPNEAVKTFNFIFRPLTGSGDIIKFNKEQSISLQDSYILIDGEKLNSSNVVLNDYNSVELRMGKNKQITVNGVTEGVPNPEEIVMEDMQIGGKDEGFVGGIRDIIINNRLFQFDNTTVKDFENVEIGREKPLVESNINVKSLTMSNMTNSMQNTDRCTEFDDNDIEQDAVKFGDKPNSYTYIKSKFWRSNFTLQFDFRTFYPNGVIFVSSNKRKNYILLELKEGQLQLNIEGRKKQVKTLPISSGRVNDGKWHHVRLSRKLKKLTVILDKESKPSRINMRIKPKDEILFGGVAPNSEYTEILDLKSRLLPFRGCMKSLEINNEQQFLINNKNVQHSNITLCFSKVEEGAYFGGDAYAVYREEFQISEMLELSFEFRTSEQNGILLSVSNHGDYPALSVELQNGAIVMAVNLGNGVVTNVTNNLNSDIALCNNKWHNVTALYSSSELTVNVDGIRKSWVQSDINSTMDEMEAPLYIGGLPDNAPIGTLKTLTNFKGCIRKLKIENQLMDWSDMKELNNVLLNSCPVSENSKNNYIP